MRSAAIVATSVVLLAGCERKPAAPPTSAPATRPTTRPSLTTAPVVRLPQVVPPVPAAPPAKPARPLRPSGTDWARPVDFTDPDADARFDATTPGGNRLHIRSDNVRVLRLDLHHLPVGVPANGPWNLTIDEQAIEITGRKGRVITLIRSPGGNWEVAETRD